MPIDKTRYPQNWTHLSSWIRTVRAANTCEGSPAYPACHAHNHQPHPITGSDVVLTVAHLDHDTTNNHPDNLRALCQRCHLTHDAKLHAMHAAQTRRTHAIAQGQLPLFTNPQEARQ